MFKRKKKKTGVQTPEFRKPTPPPPPPTSGSNAFKPTPVTVLPNHISTVTIMCHYETPCGWCTKWDKKCDKKIGREKPTDEPIVVNNYVSPAMQAMFKGERYNDTVKIHFEGENEQ